MKKSIIVLLIAVLVSGFAFAGTLKGSAGLNFVTDLEGKTWGFGNPKEWKYNFEFAYETSKVDVNVKGETKAWAELAISASAKAFVKDGAATSGTVSNTYEVKLSQATINFAFGEKTLVIDITGAGSAKNYVTSYSANSTPEYKPYDSKTDDKVTKSAKPNVAAPPAPGLAGFNFKYDGFSGGLGAKGKWTDDDFFYDIFLHVETKTFNFAEKAVSVDAAAYALLSNYFVSTKEAEHKDWEDKNTFGGGLKIHYGRPESGKGEDKVEADKLQANVATDLKYIDAETTKDFLWEVGADATYTIAKGEKVTFNLYLTQGKLLPYIVNNAKAPATNYIYPACKAYYDGDYADALKLDAKVGYEAHTFTFSEGNTLALSGSVEIKDALVPQRELIVGAKEVLTLSVEKKLVLTFTETYSILVAKTLGLSASATYTAKDDNFVATATVAPSFQFATSEKDALTALKVSAEIYSEKVISLAKVGLKYESADFAKKAVTATTEKIINKGTVTAYVEIKFPNALPKKDDAAKDASAAK